MKIMPVSCDMPETSGWVIDKKTLDDVFKQLEESRKAIDAAEKIIREHTISRDIKPVDLPVRTLTLPDLKPSMTAAEMLELVGLPKGSVSTLTLPSANSKTTDESEIDWLKVGLPKGYLKTTDESEIDWRKMSVIGFSILKLILDARGIRSPIIDISGDALELFSKM